MFSNDRIKLLSVCYDSKLYLTKMKTLLENFKNFIESDDNEEIDEGAGLCHNKKTGHFSDCKAGAVYSLSKKGASRAGVDDKYVGRGTVTSKKDGEVKYRSLYGQNSSKDKSCGRIRFPDGEEGYKKYSCSKYSEKYDEQKRKTHPLVPSSDDAESDRLDKLGYTHDLRAMAKGIVRREDTEGENGLFISLDDLIRLLQSIPDNHNVLENNDAMNKKCRQLGYRTSQEYFQQLVQTVNLLKQSFDGKLGDTK